MRPVLTGDSNQPANRVLLVLAQMSSGWADHLLPGSPSEEIGRGLTRHAGPFEGLAPVRVLVEVDDLAVAQFEVLVDAEIDLHPASHASAGQVQAGHDAIRAVLHLLDIDLMTLPVLEPAPPDTDGGLMTPGQDMPLLDRIPLDARIQHAEKGLLVMLEGLNGSEHDRDVLLRHALLLQAGGFEGFSAQSERVKCAPQGQVILDPDESPVPEPAAVVEVAFNRHSARSSLGRHVSQNKDAIIRNGP